MGKDFSGSCTVTSRNSLIQKGATTATKAEPFWPQRSAPGSIVKGLPRRYEDPLAGGPEPIGVRLC